VGDAHVPGIPRFLPVRSHRPGAVCFLLVQRKYATKTLSLTTKTDVESVAKLTRRYDVVLDQIRGLARLRSRNAEVATRMQTNDHDPERAKAEMAAIELAARNALQDVRNTIRTTAARYEIIQVVKLL